MIGAYGGTTSTGAALAGLASCGACHTADEGVPFAGGHAIETPFGTFYGSNLTPDREHGLGGWELADFVRAMRKGRSPQGHSYWPAFPYPSFTQMQNADLEALWAYLRSLPASPTVDRAHEAPAGWQRAGWRFLNFRPRRFKLDSRADPVAERGRYLVEAVGHCGECHSPRGKFGRIKRRRALEGGSAPFNTAPAIDPMALEAWSMRDLETFFTLGMLPDGDFAGGGMSGIVGDGLSQLSPGDREAIAVWLKRPL